MVLQRCHVCRDFRIIFDPALCFTNHTDDVVEAACKMYGFKVRSIKAFEDIILSSLCFTSLFGLSGSMGVNFLSIVQSTNSKKFNHVEVMIRLFY